MIPATFSLLLVAMINAYMAYKSKSVLQKYLMYGSSIIVVITIFLVFLFGDYA